MRLTNEVADDLKATLEPMAATIQVYDAQGKQEEIAFMGVMLEMPQAEAEHICNSDEWTREVAALGLEIEMAPGWRFASAVKALNLLFKAGIVFNPHVQRPVGMPLLELIGPAGFGPSTRDGYTFVHLLFREDPRTANG